MNSMTLGFKRIVKDHKVKNQILENEKKQPNDKKDICDICLGSKTIPQYMDSGDGFQNYLGYEEPCGDCKGTGKKLRDKKVVDD